MKPRRSLFCQGSSCDDDYRSLNVPIDHYESRRTVVAIVIEIWNYEFARGDASRFAIRVFPRDEKFANRTKTRRDIPIWCLVKPSRVIHPVYFLVVDLLERKVLLRRDSRFFGSSNRSIELVSLCKHRWWKQVSRKYLEIARKPSFRCGKDRCSGAFQFLRCFDKTISRNAFLSTLNRENLKDMVFGVQLCCVPF